jgi:hypothetical protein
MVKAFHAMLGHFGLTQKVPFLLHILILVNTNEMGRTTGLGSECRQCSFKRHSDIGNGTGKPLGTHGLTHTRTRRKPVPTTWVWVWSWVHKIEPVPVSATGTGMGSAGCPWVRWSMECRRARCSCAALEQWLPNMVSRSLCSGRAA